MRRNILRLPGFLFALIAVLFLTRTDFFSAGFQIKSLRVYSNHDQTSFPVLDLSEKTKNLITIEFDVQSDNMPNLSIVFRFCDSDWNVYDSAFLLNPLYNTEYNIWFDNLPITIRGAHYHYSGSFPNNNVNFPYSGNWKFFIVDSNNRNIVYDSGRFFVVKPFVNLNVEVAREGLQGDNSKFAVLQRSISIRTNFTLPDTLFPSNVKKVVIIQNRKMYYPIVIDRINYTEDRFYEWNASNKFSFIARNLHPGNRYRETDLRDIGKYGTPTVNAKFGNIETSNLFTKEGRDFYGGSLLMNFKNEYAGYMNVVFKLRSPDDVKSSIFLVGAFNNWRVLPEYEMYDDKGMMNLSIELKRGVYDYQYVTGNVVGDHVENINWEILEGNFFETDAEYYIFLYYATPEKGGYEKVIGYKKINTGAL
ncbi:MAG: DUF5103 domain-containing protein [Bacteroidetes bacterium]|nr:DUF5103 domain-containing protein [Bacteroidota bacterium]